MSAFGIRHRPADRVPGGSAARRTRRGRRRRGGLGVERLEGRRVLAGTMLADLLPGPASSRPDEFTASAGKVFFRAACTDGNVFGGDELWKTDGTPGSTVLVKNIWSDIQYYPRSSVPQDLTDFNGTLYFGAEDDRGRELWRSDGTSAGTLLDVELVGGSGYDKSGFPEQLVAIGENLFFTGYDLLKLNRVYVLDSYGNAQALSGFLDPTELVKVGDTLFFSATNGVAGRELWQATGGYASVLDIVTGSKGSNPGNFVDVDGTLFFTADNGVNGRELWKSDGTPGGTVMVADINPGSESSGISWLTNVDGMLYFTADDGVNGSELWKFNPQGRAGTVPVMVKNIHPRGSSSPSELTAVGNLLFFTADFATGPELYRSNGTAEGTFSVRDINPGSAGSYPQHLTNVGGTLFFTANDGTHGRELWQTDGTLGGTMLVNDIRPGAESSDPGSFAAIGGTLFFSADDGVHGDEPWSLAALRPHAGGPYAVPENGSVVLSAALSACDPGSTITAYAWDFDYDGTSFDEDFTSPFPAASFDAHGIDGPAVRTVAVRIRDELGRSRVATATVTITNAAPTASLSGPNGGVRGQTLDFALSAFDPSAADMAAGFTYRIDFGDGSGTATIARTADNGTGDVTASHLFTKSGTYSIRVSAIDVGGAVGAVTVIPVTINAACIRPDPVDPDVTNLYVGGTPANDLIRLNPGPTANKIRVLIGGSVVGVFTRPSGRAVVFGQAGHDTIRVGPTVTLAAELHGDEGNDQLFGGAGRDILHGGPGLDTLNGGVGDDILVPGTTGYDTDIAAWSGIFDEWSRTDAPYAVRVANLLSGAGLNEPYALKPAAEATVFNDSVADSVAGGLGNDAFFTSPGDTIADLAKVEINTTVSASKSLAASVFAAAGTQASQPAPTGKTTFVSSLKSPLFAALSK